RRRVYDALHENHWPTFVRRVVLQPRPTRTPAWRARESVRTREPLWKFWRSSNHNRNRRESLRRLTARRCGEADLCDGAAAILRPERDACVVDIGDPLSNRQAKAGPVSAGPRRVAAIEALEDVRHLVLGNPDTGVGDGEQRALRRIGYRYRDRATGMCELDGVIEEDHRELTHQRLV